MKSSRWVDNNHRITLLILITAALFISGCNLPVEQNIPTETPALVFPTSISTSAPAIVSATPILLAPTLTPVDTATTIPPSPIPSNPIPTTAPVIPTAIVPAAIRINFATGATSGFFREEIRSGQVMNFLVGVAKDQPMMISSDSPNHDVTFSVLGLTDGQTLVDASSKVTSWQGILTLSQDYLVTVSGGASKELFTLNIITPARINFEPGAISATRKGLTPGGLNVSYVLRANAGQQMDISLQAPQGNAVLSIYGYQDGNPYLRSVLESTTFSIQLPVSQDYIIQVVPYAGQVANYILNITIK